jgi:hypothetical protein
MFALQMIAAVLSVVFIGMIMCMQGGIGRLAASGEWLQPLSVIGYLLGAAIIVIGVPALYLGPGRVFRPAAPDSIAEVFYRANTRSNAIQELCLSGCRYYSRQIFSFTAEMFDEFKTFDARRLGTGFDISHSLHGLAFMLGIPSLPVAALLISRSLLRKSVGISRRSLLWAANLPWMSIILMVAVVFIGLSQSGGEFGPNVLIGWPDRLVVLAHCGWLMAVARGAIQAERQPSRSAD